MDMANVTGIPKWGIFAKQYFPDVLTHYYTNGTCMGSSCTYPPEPVHHENENVKDPAIVRSGQS